MNTADVITLLGSVPAITNIVGDKIVNSRMPTKDATTGSYDTPFLWVQMRNHLNWGAQNPEAGTQPLGKVFDLEAVADTASEAEALRDAVYSLHGYAGFAGSAAFDACYVTDQSDDYAPRNAPGDAGVFVNSLLLEAIGE